MSFANTFQTSKEGRDDDGSTIHAFPLLPQGFKSDPMQREQMDINFLEDVNSLSCQPLSLLPVAWGAVLACYTESEEVHFGVAYRGRQTDKGTQFISPFRLRVSNTETLLNTMAVATQYDERMRRFQKMGLEGYAALNPGNIVLSNFNNLLVIAGETHDVSAEVVEEKYPLTLYARGANLRACFDPRVLSANALRPMLNHFADFVQAAIERPDRTILDAQRVGKKGFALLQEWHASREKGLRDDYGVRAHELINDQILSDPSAPAVSAWDGELTRGELDHWASYLGHHLVSEGCNVQPGQFVGLLLSKSVATVPAMLSVIRSGAGFVFLSPSLPIERIRTMCRIAGVVHILTNSRHKEMAAKLDIPVTEVDNRPSSAVKVERFDRPMRFGPLYLAFTSGSTGEPKGVQINRESFGPGIARFCEETKLDKSSRLFQSVSYAFVVSILETLTGLAVGACICIPSEEDLENDFEGELNKFKATWAWNTPTMTRTLRADQLPFLKTLVLAGEPITSADAAQWKGLSAPYSLYAQSETASTFYIRRLNEPTYESGNLGNPTTGRYWVVEKSDHTRLSTIGTDGELLIESTALGSFYINNPEMTAATFVEEPVWAPQQDYAPQLKRQWILTGDMVRHNCKDGSLQIVGRKGTRTKIRGQRIELGEIESCLRPYFPSQQVVAEVVTPAAASVEVGQSPAILLAFTCSNMNKSPSGSPVGILLREEHRVEARKALSGLQQALPSYMIPADILELDHLPRTVSGKVHRKALRDWAAQRPLDQLVGVDEVRVAFRAAETFEEQALQSICVKVLGLPSEKISLDDNFFRIGGDSLTARQVVSAARSQGLTLTVSNVFNEPTLAVLAKVIRKSDAAVNDAGVKESPFARLKTEFLQQGLPAGLNAHQVQAVLPLTFMQAQTTRAATIDYFPMEFEGAVDVDRLRVACQQILDVNPALRSIFLPFKQETVQIILRQAAISWTEVTAPADSDLNDWTHSWIMQDREHSPPMSQITAGCTLIRHYSGRTNFVMRLAHSQYDGVCLGPIFKQLETFYSDSGAALKYHPKEDFISYRKTCARMRTPQALEHWKNLLTDIEITELPRLGYPSELTYAVHHEECKPAEPPAGITQATAIKAAWAYTLAQETGKPEVLFGQITNCRGVQPDAGDEVIGMCLNTTPVRVKVEPTTRVRDFLGMVQQQHIEALEYETTEWPDMVATGTSWPAGTELDSLVLHENFANLKEFSLGDVTSRLGEPIFKPVGSKSHILVTFPGPQSLMTFLMTRIGCMEKTKAEMLVSKFNETLVRFLAYPNSLIGPVN
ncbi:uncharacterized protein N7477_005758 [Penicillium maclennaniae]|uniref:uncharacterized protein n=1 Tax=Penicillium maclennaniae TaxID=1343394 RepID=UPI002541BC76|nr:uncharacterized protein N7477_005758 [Penicillium maclennaniae]KAJ5670395.1 hypothetical protein N7477_005758 [Penicillium maclennaniae]